MSESSTFHDHSLEWLRVWQSPWLMMHPSWHTCIPDVLRFSDHWQRVSPSTIRSFFSIDDHVPLEPREALKTWVLMSESTRSDALHLAAEIVFPNLGRAYLKEREVVWSRHIAKALTPGKWPVDSWQSLPSESVGFLLLRQWLPPIALQRVRLFYDKRVFDATSSIPFVDIPEQRLNQLWHAVMWRLSDA